MEFLLIFAALAVPAVAGYLFVSWFLGSKGTEAGLESLFLGYGVGLGLLTYVIFIIGLLNISFSVQAITPVMAAFIAAFIFLKSRRKRTGAFHAGNAGFRLEGVGLLVSVMVAAWVLAKLSFIFFETFNRPVYAWDTWGNWSVGAKFFFYSKGFILDKADENFFGRYYRAFLGHPLHNHLLQLWVSLWLGSFHEVYVKAWAPFYFIGLLGLFFLALRRSGAPFYAVAGVFFLASAPIMTYHAQEAYSDVPLSYYAFGATAYLWRFLETDENRFASLSGILAAIGMSVKNEGVFFFLAIGLALLLYLVLKKKTLTPLLSYLIPVAIIAGPWFAVKLAYGFGFGHGSESSGFNWLSDPTFGGEGPKGVHWEIFGVMVREVFLTANFNLLFAFWLAVTVMGGGYILKTNIKYLYLIIISVISMFVFVYLTLEVTAVTEATGLHRNIISYAPIIFFASLLLAQRILGRARGEERGR